MNEKIDISDYDPNDHEGWVQRLREYLSANGIRVWNDPAELEPLVIQIISQNPKQVEAYRKGKKQILGFFIKQIMDATKSGADPTISHELFTKHLAE